MINASSCAIAASSSLAFSTMRWAKPCCCFGGMIRWGHSDCASLSAQVVGGFMSSVALRVQRNGSRISSFKEEGYYRLAKLQDIHIQENFYTVLAVRGGGPGGQGSNSSSSKVEMRVSIVALQDHFDEDLITKLKENERGRSLTADEALIIVTSHEHRSAHQNKEECIHRVKEMIQRASWVPPVEPGSIKRPSSLLTSHKAERRRRSNVKKMQRAARKGIW